MRSVSPSRKFGSSVVLPCVGPISPGVVYLRTSISSLGIRVKCWRRLQRRSRGRYVASPPTLNGKVVSAKGTESLTSSRRRGTREFKVYVGHDGPNTRAWDFEPVEVSLRYSDVPPTRTFHCPTLPTFCAMKTRRLVDRHAPRDLFPPRRSLRPGCARRPSLHAGDLAAGEDPCRNHQARVRPSSSEPLRQRGTPNS